MARLGELATWPRIIGLIVVPAVSLVVDHQFGNWALTALLLTVYVAILFAFLMDHHTVPSAYLNTRKLHSDARKQSERHPILMRRYLDGVSDTEHLLREIIDEQFEYNVTEVPDMSIFAMDIVDGRCLLTFPLEESENFLIPKTGPSARYYSSMVEASKKIKANGRRGVVRVFIIKRQDDIGDSLIAFMRDNASDGIHVRVIFEERLPIQPDEIEFRDFGCYETADGSKWIMALRRNGADTDGLRYVVNTDEKVYGQYRSYGDDIDRLSMSLDEFEEILLNPPNGKLWPVYFAEREYIMNPPHGLSEEDADFIVDTAVRRIKDLSKAKILVLGFTPKLIRRLVDLKVGCIISIDQCRSKPADFDIVFETGNWLKIDGKYEADAVVFDESINNLAHLQLGLFFANMAKALKPGGVLVGRAMGRFDAEKAGAYASMTQGRIIELLRKSMTMQRRL